MSNYLITDRHYPYLSIDYTLFLYKNHGIIQNSSTNYEISYSTAKLLKNFTGEKTFEEHFQQNNTDILKDDIEIYKAMINIIMLLDQNIININENAEKKSINIINRENYNYPHSLHIEVTNNCNLSCYYCYNSSGSDKNNSNIDVCKLLNVLELLRDRGLKIIELTGGEPLLHPQFADILKYCTKNFKFISILTNGILINNNFIENLRSLPDKNKILFSIVLDSHIASVHNERRGNKDTFYKTLKGIKLIIKEGFITRIGMVVDEHNWNHLEDTLKFAMDIGATNFSFSPIIPSGRAISNKCSFWNIDKEEILKKIHYIGNKYKEFLHISNEIAVKSLKDKGGCGAGTSGYIIDPFGNIKICPIFPANKGNLGNIFNQSPEFIFQNKLSKLIENIIPPTLDECYNCKLVEFCTGCYFRGYLGSKEIGKENCKWAKNKNVSNLLEILN